MAQERDLKKLAVIVLSDAKGCAPAVPRDRVACLLRNGRASAPRLPHRRRLYYAEA